MHHSSYRIAFELSPRSYGGQHEKLGLKSDFYTGRWKMSSDPPPYSPQLPPPYVPNFPPPVNSGVSLNQLAPHPVPEGSKSFIVALLLGFFLGMFGADRFYLGKNRSAFLKLVTLGGFGYWMVADLLMTLFGAQRDEWGLRLRGYDKYGKSVRRGISVFLGLTLLLSIITLAISASFDSEGPTTTGWILIAASAFAAAIAGIIWITRRRVRKRTTAKVSSHDPVPPRIRVLEEKLNELRHMYIFRAAAGDEVAANVVKQLDSLLVNITELFHRLKRGSSRRQRKLATAEYEDKLERLIKILDRDQLLDVLAHPHLWDKSENRVRAGQRAIMAVDAQLVDNIRQVNARRDLVFQPDLDDVLDFFRVV